MPKLAGPKSLQHHPVRHYHASDVSEGTSRSHNTQFTGGFNISDTMARLGTATRSVYCSPSHDSR